MSKTKLLVVLFILLPLPLLLGQCNKPSVYYLDGDGDSYGTNDFDSVDIEMAIKDFNDAHTGETIYYGNIAYGCSKPTGFANNFGDCDDGNGEAHAIVVWFTDEDGDGAYGTKHSGCEKPPANSSTFSNDCDDNDVTVKTLQTF